jgi:hypothetical protein
MFLAGLYVGLGSRGIEEASPVSSGIFGGFGGNLGMDVESEDGIGLGPAGRRAKGSSLPKELYSDADGILTIERGSWLTDAGGDKAVLVRKAANLSSTDFMELPCIPSGFGRTGGFGLGDMELLGGPLGDCGLPSPGGISNVPLCGLEDGAGQKPFRRSMTGVGGEGSTKFLVFSFMMMPLIFRNCSSPDASLLRSDCAWMVVALVVLLIIVG